MRPGAKEAALLLPRKLAELFAGPAERAIRVERKRRTDIAETHQSDDSPREHTIVAFTHRYDPDQRKLQRTKDL